ncbi:hypothetical protein VB738_14485 [Cyanobium gracile UHCC 0139]|uniref:Uncharacterized protein n=1 Tax=Cyanobium gracile UHCC 0139 TaxID=3110308 RepID=A0ABU5RXG5_9CYAN|nr:hypothetical protein [Cyanobium gracile]MEA5392467.1 hypothetical protein [Cyanobium gracile UHCC 0139]
MATPLPSLITLTLLLALPLTLALSMGIGWRYRAGVRRLMRLAPLPSEAIGVDSGDTPCAARRQPARVPPIRRERPLVLSLGALSLLVGFTSATLFLLVHFGSLAPLRLLILSLVMATPGLVLQVQILRWPFPRQLLALGGWGLALLLLVRLSSAASGEEQAGLVVPQLLGPLIVLGLLFGIPRLRAIAPFLLPPVVLLVLLAVLGQQLLAALVAQGPGGVLGVLLALVGAWGTLLLFTVLPIAIALLPAHALTAALGRLYRAKAFSDLSYLFGASWFLILLLQVLPGWNALAGGGDPLDPRPLLPMLAWLWIPLFFAGGWRRSAAPAVTEPPTLLVLRVFRRSGPVGWLFDHVVQRWRAVGPVLLISAADLASRTIEPDELVSFLEGRLRDRYILEAEDLHRQLAAIDASPDHDGRYRVTDFCCYASSWKQTLDALLDRASSVLMDLRGFQARNQGCLYELGRISQASHLSAVVLLTDDQTDRAAAEHALQTRPDCPPVQWVEAPRPRVAGVDLLLDRLLASGR